MLSRWLSSIAHTRASVVAATLLYGYSINYAHVEYLNPIWGYFGFSYRAPEPFEIVFIVTLLLIGAAALPKALNRPSSIVVLLLFIVVYVPAVVINLCLDTDRLARYGPSLTMFGFGFMCACLASRMKQPSANGADPRPPGAGFRLSMLVLWGVCCAVLLATYGSIMALPGLEDIYTQREAGRSTNLLMGYTQTYFSNVFSPALVALGLLRRRWLLVAIGTAGCVIMFMISAQRTILLLPPTIALVAFALRNQSQLMRTSSFALTFIAIAVFLPCAYYEDNLVVGLIATLLVFRTLALPGLTFSQYHDLFQNDGYTWWSHIKGLSLVIPAPSSYETDPAWPNLGFMVGERFYGNIEHNVNANLFSGDGVAAAGPLGVLIIGVVLAVWLRWLDRTSRGWNRNYAILAVLPIALSLTNGHFFTTLLSFGGLFWMLTFYLYKPGGPARPARSAGAPS